MPEGEKTFTVTTTITASQAREFLNRAAHDDDFRDRLENSPADPLSEYGVELTADVDVESCLVPSKHYCEQLLARVDEIDEYAEADYAPIALAALVLTVGYAMPLVATTEPTGAGHAG
jgi:hypothetical protein